MIQRELLIYLLPGESSYSLFGALVLAAPSVVKFKKALPETAVPMGFNLIPTWAAAIAWMVWVLQFYLGMETWVQSCPSMRLTKATVRGRLRIIKPCRKSRESAANEAAPAESCCKLHWKYCNFLRSLCSKKGSDVCVVASSRAF